MFKRKQERSEWMEGLLYAEQSIQDGLVPDDNLMFWNEDRTFATGFADFRVDAKEGISDYLDHYENNLKNILK